MQNVRFGLSLDGQRGWHARNALGASVVGPAGMLQLLETQLGLQRAPVSLSERVVQMRGCIEQVLSPQRFFAETYGVDQLGTAATLLSWRDLWLEHGWTGAGAESSLRLRDMADLEVIARQRVAPGTAERLQEVARALERRRPQFEQVVLLDPIEDFPAAWRNVLALLPVQAAAVACASAPPGTTLRDLQEALAGALSGSETRRVAWKDDGSVRVVRGESRVAAADWCALQQRKAGGDRVVVAEANGSVLDSALAAAGLPRLGLSQPSAYRPTLQLLPLAMRLLWDPCDIPALLQFLTHPVCPLQSSVRYQLARKMAQAPGIGGTTWDELVASLEREAGEDSGRVRTDIAFWVAHQRVRPSEGANIAGVLERVERLAEFFRAGSHGGDETQSVAWEAGHGQARAVAQCLGAMLDQKTDRIQREALERLVEQATSHGASNPDLQAEAGAGGAVSDPGAVIEAFDSVLWWHLSATSLPSRYPWSHEEIEELGATGASLPSTAALLERQSRNWLKPILLAARDLTLVLPPPGEEVHPVWQLVDSVLKDAPVFEVESVASAAAVAGETSAVPHRPLPAARRWWQLPPGPASPRPDTASYSSLERLIYNPAQWVLQYPARIEKSVVLSAPDTGRMLGTLAHRIVEQLYRQSESLAWPDAQVLAWFDQHVDRIVSEEGAVLLMPGRKADLAIFKQRFRASLARLHRHLREAKVAAVVPEKKLEGTCALGKVVGSSDLSLVLSDGRKAVVDMKWSGVARYRQKLEKATHLQLGVYAWLEQEGDVRWPQVAYFILREGQMLAASDELFPSVRAVANEDQTPLVWNRLLATWQWRLEQLGRGEIEVVLDGVEATDRSQPPPGALEIEALERRFNPYINLMGRED